MVVISEALADLTLLSLYKILLILNHVLYQENNILLIKWLNIVLQS